MIRLTTYVRVQFALCMYVATCVCDNLVNFIHRFYYDVTLILNQHLVCLNIIGVGIGGPQGPGPP